MPEATVYTIGESMARMTSSVVGPLRHSDTLRVGIAGAESNVAIGLSRLGVPTSWLGRVGDDEFGRLIVRALRGEDVRTTAIVDDAAPTGLLVKERRTSTSTSVQYYRAGSAGSRLTPADLDERAIAEAEILHVTGITLALSATARDTVVRAVEIARLHGTTVSFDVNHRARLWPADEAAPVLRALAEQADIVFAGDHEAALLASGETPLALAHAIAELGPREVIVKSGADGAVAVIDGEEHVAPILRVAELDPVGAGDAFTAGYLAEAVAAADTAQRLDTAARCGAFAVTVDGDWEGLPTRAELSLLDGGGVRR